MCLCVILVWLLILHVHMIRSISYQYSSREYQIVLRPDLLLNSFETGVMRVIDILAKLEDEKLMQFKVSKSSLKFQNVTLLRYVTDDDRDLTDFYVEPVFKSKQNNETEPADIVTKVSNVDPELAHVELSIAQDYMNQTEIKFELDIHCDNGELTAKSAMSYKTRLPLDFDHTAPINLSSILTDVDRLTISRRPVTIVPNSVGKIEIKTATFNVKLAGKTSKAAITFHLHRGVLKAELSFRVKGMALNPEVLHVAQQLGSYLSKIRAIALYAIIHPKK